ncbi:MAG: hypothetical protein ABR583_08290 [Gaiellaceae bacterium]
MNELEDIRRDIDELSERRTKLWHRLSDGRDPSVAAEVKELDERLARLWDAQRQLRATLRFGDRTRIVARARMEERLERAA